MKQFMRFLVLFLLLCGTVGASTAFAAPRVWFDEGHAQAFKVDAEGELQLTGLGQVFGETGWEVLAGGDPLTAQLLQDKQALVISGPFKPLSTEEIEAVLAFVKRGGRLAVMLHIGPPLSSLLKPLGILHSNGVIHEQQNVLDGEPLNFRASLATPHPVTAGLDGFSLYGSWALLAEGAQTEVLAGSSVESWVDLNGNKQLDVDDARQSFAVLVHGRLDQGEYLVFADDAIFQNRFLVGDNLVLAHNLASWLQGGPPAGELALLMGR